MGRAWCPDCRRMQPVADEYLTDEGDLRTEGAGRTRTYVAQPLECGHSASDGSDRPAVSPRFRPDPTLVPRLVELQRGARARGW